MDQTTRIDSYAFHSVNKFCETCGVKLKLTANVHIKRKRFCSASCRMKGINKHRFAQPAALNHTCKMCCKTKPICDFYTVTYKDKKYPRQFCKKCYKGHVYAMFEKHPEWVEQMRTRRKLKRAALPFRMESARDLGLTLAEAFKMYTDQCGKCAVCGAPPQNGRRLALEHNHATGEPRQFLCCSCNADLSVIENKARFEKLQAYLVKHEPKIH